MSGIWGILAPNPISGDLADLGQVGLFGWGEGSSPLRCSCTRLPVVNRPFLRLGTIRRWIASRNAPAVGLIDLSARDRCNDTLESDTLESGERLFRVVGSPCSHRGVPWGAMARPDGPQVLTRCGFRNRRKSRAGDFGRGPTGRAPHRTAPHRPPRRLLRCSTDEPDFTTTSAGRTTDDSPPRDLLTSLCSPSQVPLTDHEPTTKLF